MQHRRPMLGSGRATPIGFGPMELNSSLVVGSDGLFSYTKLSSVKELATNKASTASDMAGLAKNMSGKLNDDVSVIVIHAKVR